MQRSVCVCVCVCVCVRACVRACVCVLTHISSHWLDEFPNFRLSVTIGDDGSLVSFSCHPFRGHFVSTSGGMGMRLMAA